MTITITLKGVLLTSISILSIVLLIYLIILVANLVKTLKKANEILDDAKVVSETAAEKTKQIDRIVDDMGESVETVVKTLKGNQSIVSALTNVVNAASSFVNIVKKTQNKENTTNQDK